MGDFTLRLNAKGLRQAAAAFRQAGVDMQQLKGAYKEMSGVVKQGVAGVIPVRSGDLKRSLRASATQKSGVVRAGRASIPYAGVINYGWPGHNIEAQHYMERGLELSEAEVISLYAEAIQDALDTI